MDDAEKENPMATLKTTIFTAALVCAAIPSANAAFEPRNVPPFNGVDLECAIMKTSDGYKKDADPIYKIVVGLSLEDGNPTSMTVTHVSAGGSYYTRDK
jgi:hypothetical protein